MATATIHVEPGRILDGPLWCHHHSLTHRWTMALVGLTDHGTMNLGTITVCDET